MVKEVYVAPRFKSSLQNFYGHHHEQVDSSNIHILNSNEYFPFYIPFSFPLLPTFTEVAYMSNTAQGLKLAVAHSPFASKFQCGPLKISSQSSTWRVKIRKNKIV